MQIKFLGKTICPPNTSPRGAMAVANMYVFSCASEYADINLGRMSKIHYKKISLWKHGKKLLMLDELLRISNLLNLNMEIIEDE